MGSTPYEIVTGVQPAVRAPKRTLLAVSRELEREALLDPPREVAATLQDVRYLTPRTRAVYVALAEAGARARLFARSLQAWVAPGVAGVALDDDDPLVDQWSIVVPAARRPVVFTATDCYEPDVEDLDRSFCYTTSRDPELVRACAESLGLSPDLTTSPGESAGRI